MFRCNIAEEDPHSWFIVQYKLFTRINQGLLDEKLLKKLGMIQRVIRESTNIFHIILR